MHMIKTGTYSWVLQHVPFQSRKNENTVMRFLFMWWNFWFGVRKNVYCGVHIWVASDEDAMESPIRQGVRYGAHVVYCGVRLYVRHGPFVEFVKKWVANSPCGIFGSCLDIITDLLFLISLPLPVFLSLDIMLPTRARNVAAAR